MKINEPGILPASDIYFHTCSSHARQLFYYLLCTGHYFCDNSYTVDRQNYNSFLIMYINSGSGFLEFEGKALPLKAGSVVLLDCYKPHKYYTRTQLETYWIHFDGVLARQYYNMIAADINVFVPQLPYQALRSLKAIFSFFHENKKTNEALISKHITDLLTELYLITNTNTSPYKQSGVIDETISYILKNLSQPLLLTDLAKMALLSPYYFARLFKKETGYATHQYILLARIDMAKFYLKTTKQPIKEIAYKSGFNSESGFCTAFKQITGTTPTVYRLGDGSDKE